MITAITSVWDVASSPEGPGMRLAQTLLHYPCTDVESINIQGLLVAGIDVTALSMHCQMLRGGTISVRGDCLWQAQMVWGDRLFWHQWPFIPDIMDGPGGPLVA